jgi:hypothetical protein
MVYGPWSIVNLIKMNRNLLLLFLFSIVFQNASAQKTVNGVTLPASIKKDKTELMLNGAGIRKKVFFKLYVAGLYLETKTTNGYEVIMADKEMLMRLTITSGMISSENMSEAIEEGFQKSMNGNTAPLKAQIETFIHTFKKEPIKEGDVFELHYMPGTGVQTIKNGKLQTTISGIDFKKALFGIWFSGNPVDADLKKSLLGL